MAPTTNFEKAEADRGSYKDHLEFLETELARHATIALTQHEANMYFAEVEEDRKLLGANHSQIRLYAPKGADLTLHIQEYRSLSALASRLSAGFHGIKMSFPAPATASTSSSSSSASATSSCTTGTHRSIKLPPLEIPKFSGNLQGWVSFRDLFVNAVHNSSLSNVEKLTQLKSLLTGEASRQVRSILLSDANYDIAWSALKERYENNRELLFSIIKRLLNQPAVTAGSAVHLRSLIDTTKECIRSLEVLTIPTQHWDAILLYILFSKMDNASRELWEQTLTDTSVPALSKMYEFLEQRSRALAASSAAPPQPRAPQRVNHNQNPVRVHHASPSTCKIGCTEGHPLYKCPEFRKQSNVQRSDTIKKLKLCLNCFGHSHMASACPSQNRCKVCNRKHHSMIHLEQGQVNQQHHTVENANQPAVTSHHAYQEQVSIIKPGLLATARVKVITSSGDDPRRTLVDSGSTNTQITEEAARHMNLPLTPCSIHMTGTQCASLGSAKYVTSFSFKPHFDSMSVFSATALVVSSISGNIPSEKLQREKWTHLHGLQLADPDFQKPEPVDILFGTDIAWMILENEKIMGKEGEPLAVKSSLGYLVAGKNNSASEITVFNTTINLDATLRKFWEQETIPEEEKHSKEEEECEKHFASTHKKTKSGRFIISLPFKLPRLELGASRQAAVKRFLGLENKFVHHRNITEAEKIRKLTDQWKQYKDFMLEYEQLGHMELIPENEYHSQLQLLHSTSLRHQGVKHDHKTTSGV